MVEKVLRFLSMLAQRKALTYWCYDISPMTLFDGQLMFLISVSGFIGYGAKSIDCGFEYYPNVLDNSFHGTLT